MTVTLKRAVDNINRVLIGIDRITRREFRLLKVKPDTLTPGVLMGNAAEISPIIDAGIKVIKTNQKHLRVGLREKSSDDLDNRDKEEYAIRQRHMLAEEREKFKNKEKKKRKKIEKKIKDVVKELKGLRAYFEYLIKHKGRKPKGFFSTLKKYNEYPMARMSEGLRDQTAKYLEDKTGY